MKAFQHQNNSCFIDSLLVALFVPVYTNDVFAQLVANGEIKHSQVLHPVVQNVRQSVMHSTTHPCIDLFVAQLPHYMNGNAPQSAVDLYDYLVGHTNFIQLREHTISFHKNRHVPPTRMASEINDWWDTECIHTYTGDTIAKQLRHFPGDKDDIHALLNDDSLLLSYTLDGDVRRSNISKTHQILCNVSGSGAQNTHYFIGDDIKPRFIRRGGDVGCQRTLWMFSHINPVENPVLVFSVNRSDNSRLSKRRKLFYGDVVSNNDIVIQLEPKTYYFLVAVVCLVHGHYVTFFRWNHEWFYYDDMAPSITRVDKNNMEVHQTPPSKYGEMFFYTI